MKEILIIGKQKVKEIWKDFVLKQIFNNIKLRIMTNMSLKSDLKLFLRS